MTAKGWLKDGERKLLFEAASRLPGDAAILNIGVEFGASLACLRAGNPTATIHAFDIDMSKVLEGGYGAVLYELDSHEAVKAWKKPLDLIFVDGDHGKLGVLLDAKFADFLPVGGHILFQDCYDYDNPTIVHLVCPGVNEAVTEWFETAKQEFEELPSVETTRVFKRVKEHEQPGKGITQSSGSDTDLSPATGAGEHDNAATKKLEVRRPGRNSGRR